MYYKQKNYKVLLNGRQAELDAVRVSAIPFNRVWPGKQRDIEQSELAYVLHIASDEGAKIEVTADCDFDAAVIRPLSSGITPKRSSEKSNTVVFELTKHGQYVLEFDNFHYAIHIFYDKANDFPQKSSATYVFENGEHHVGKLELCDNESVYIGENAVLFANIYAVGKKNIHIYGYGVLDGGDETRTQKHGDIGWDDETHFPADKLHTIGCMRFFDCKNVSVEGIQIRNSSSYAASAYDSENVHFDNVKVVGHWKYNNDGIDLINCRDSVIENSFVRSFDDSICIKGFTAFNGHNSQHIRIRNCVLWCGWGKTLEIGLATACKKIHDITFSDCNLIHNSRVCLAISNGQYADISDICYNNINVEYSRDTQVPVFQESDGQNYDKIGITHVPMLLCFSDERRTWQGHISAPDEPRSVRNVTLDNVHIFTYDSEFVPITEVHRENGYGAFENIAIKSIYVNERKYADMDLLGR